MLSMDANVTISVRPAELKEFAIEVVNECLTSAAKSQEPQQAKLISQDEVADKLGVSKNTLWRWSKTGYLTPIKVGRKPFYKLSDVEALLSPDRDEKSRYAENNGYSKKGGEA